MLRLVHIEKICLLISVSHMSSSCLTSCARNYNENLKHHIRLCRVCFMCLSTSEVSIDTIQIHNFQILILITLLLPWTPVNIKVLPSLGILVGYTKLLQVRREICIVSDDLKVRCGFNNGLDALAYLSRVPINKRKGDSAGQRLATSRLWRCGSRS